MGQESVGDAGASSLGYYGGVFSSDGRRIAANGFTGALHMWQRPDAPSDGATGEGPLGLDYEALPGRKGVWAHRALLGPHHCDMGTKRPVSECLLFAPSLTVLRASITAQQQMVCLTCGCTASVDDQGRGRELGGWVPRPVRGGHSGPVVDMCWAADGACLLSVSADQTARIFTGCQGSWCEIARPEVR